VRDENKKSSGDLWLCVPFAVSSRNTADFYSALSSAHTAFRVEKRSQAGSRLLEGLRD
jgi:hypothetical protein